MKTELRPKVGQPRPMTVRLEMTPDPVVHARMKTVLLITIDLVNNLFQGTREN